MMTCDTILQHARSLQTLHCTRYTSYISHHTASDRASHRHTSRTPALLVAASHITSRPLRRHGTRQPLSTYQDPRASAARGSAGPASAPRRGSEGGSARRRRGLGRPGAPRGAGSSGARGSSGAPSDGRGPPPGLEEAPTAPFEIVSHRLVRSTRNR